MKEQNDFEAWLLSETLLAGLLGAILALFLTHRRHLSWWAWRSERGGSVR